MERRQQQRQHQRRSQDPRQPQHAQQQQQHPQDDDDPGGNKDEDTGAVGNPETTTPHGRRRGGGGGSGSGGTGTDNKHGSTNETEEETDPRLKIAKGNQRCEEREEQLLMLEAIRYLERRQPDLLASLLEELTPTSSSSRGSESCTRHAPSSTPSLTTWLPERRVAAAYWRQIALTSALDPCSDLTLEDLQRIPASPFLYRRTDALWMTRLQQSTTPTTTSSTTDSSPLVPTWKESKDPTQPRGGMRMVQDDARLFQIASGIFDGLATHPRKLRKPTHSIIDGPLTQSLDILWNLITEYGYMPLPEDDADRKMHYKGGNRAETGDESTSKKRPGQQQQQQQQQPGSQRLEGEKEGKEEDETEAGLVFPSDGSHVVNNRGLKGQGTSIWYFYDLQRVEVMIAYFVHRAPMVLEWLFERGFEILEAEQEHPIKSKRTLGVSRVSLLQCCIPGCHAMMRHIYRPLEPLKSMPSALAISRVQNELLGFGSKPKRVQFRQEDFLAALRTVAAPCLEESLQVMTELGMEVTVVQDRLVELLEIPGGLAPLDVEKSVLNVLFTQCVHGHIRSTQPESRLGVVDAINAAFHRSFQINMDPSEVLDVAWKHAFEEALVNLHPESCIVHSNVSDWVLETLGPTEPAFIICFDHAILEALVRIMTWNTEQVRRLKKWMKVQEREAKMKMRTGKKWEELKKRLVAPCDHANYSSSSSSRKSDGHENSDLVMLDVTAASSAVQVDETMRRQVGLDIEWTTNDTILQTTTTMVASLPRGSEVIRISDDNCLLLDNGCLAQDLLLLCTISGQRCRDRHESHRNQDSTETEQTETGAEEMESEEVETLDVNKRVSKFLERGAVIEEKHWIWLAMGLVTVSLQGRRVTEIPDSTVSGDKGLSMTAEANNDEALSVRMACSPEAYQLIWMTAVAFTRQMWQHIEARVVKSGDDDGNGDRSNANNDENEARRRSLPPSGTPPSSWVIHTLQSTLTSTLGDDARLLVEILSELAGEMDALNMKD
ncbi:hypothetical protein BGZ98_003043 [Dissophora globulifera]|nr:hypothetical protein BGZ98_003043 [Dissophora globulifera]